MGREFALMNVVGDQQAGRNEAAWAVEHDELGVRQSQKRAAKVERRAFLDLSLQFDDLGAVGIELEGTKRLRRGRCCRDEAKKTAQDCQQEVERSAHRSAT